jgi:putative MATE family efflux protein
MSIFDFNEAKVTIPRILKLALPVVGEMSLFMVIWLADTAMVGRYGGHTAVSAVGISSEIFFTFTNVFITMGLCIGITSLISRLLGSGQSEKIENITNLGLKIAFFISIIITLFFFFFAKDILSLNKAQGEVLRLGTTYFKICSFIIFFNVMRNTLTSVFIGFQNTKVPLLTAGIINVVNITFNYLLIFGKFGFPEFGVAGAAISTLLANIFGFFFILSQTKRLPFPVSYRFLFYKNNFSELKELLKISLPATLQEAAFRVGRLIAVSMVMALGSVSFAANQITLAIEGLSIMPGYGVAVACNTLVGFSIGQNNIPKVKQYLFYSTIIAILLMSIPGLFFYFTPTFFIEVFLDPSQKASTPGLETVINLGAQCLKIAAFAQVSTAIAMVLQGGLKGSGDTKTPMFIVLFCNWCVRLPLITYFIYYKKSSLTFLWWIICLQWTLEAIIVIVVIYRRYFREKTSKISL